MFRNFLNSRGFTLVEVLASVVLLAVVISLSLSIFPNMFRTNDVNEQSLDAVAIAKDVLVQMKNNQNGAFISKDLFVIAEAGDPAPIGDKFYWIEDSSSSARYPGYRVLIKIDDQVQQAQIGTGTPTGLDLYIITIEVYEGNSVRATNYGYVSKGDFENVPPTT